MSNNLILGRYYSTKSFIHSMNSTAKIICIFLFSAITIINSSFLFGLLLVTFNCYVILNTNVPICLYLKSLSKMKVFLIFIFAINLVFRINIFTNILMVIKTILLINYSTVLTLTTAPTEITYGLERFLSPLNKLKIPVNKLSLTISLALRFIPTIFDEAAKILKTQASRGVDYYNSDFKGKVEALKGLIIPMINLSFKRADVLADAMAVRLFSFERRRSNYRMNDWKMSDSLIVFLHLLMFIIILLKEVFL
ncbi:MAG: energy-coupling factor transporter transmembrane protein EcfT [Firmicutes bacterium]|nr:energy-coupling factor transporter transmembrane protein EcfT [Bacillota bacterium]